MLPVIMFGFIVFVLFITYVVLYFIKTYRINNCSLKNQIVLVTGAGNGLGRVLCHEFAKEECNVICVDIDPKGNQATVEEIKLILKDTKCKTQAYTCDVSNKKQVQELAEKVKKDFGDVDVLVNNAGVINVGNFMDFPEQVIRKTMDVNVLSHFWTIQEFLPAMIKKNRGHIVGIASIASFSGFPLIMPYCTSKFAAYGVMESLKIHLRYNGSDVKTLSVHPGIMETNMLSRHYNPSKSFSQFLVKKPEYVAEHTVKALKEGKSVVILPPYYYIFVLFYEVIVPYTRQIVEKLFNDSIVVDPKSKEVKVIN